jgi:predicted PurR-regulated permease PerM
MRSHESPFYPRVFGLVTALLLGIAVFKILQPFLGALLWAALLAFLLFPANQGMRRALGGRRGAAAILLTLAVALVIVLPAVMLGVVFVQQASDLVRRLPSQPDSTAAAAQEYLRIPVLDRAVAYVIAVTPITTEQIRAWTLEGGKSLLQSLIAFGGSLFTGVLGALLGFALMPFLLFFFLRDGEAMLDRLVFLIPMAEGRKAHLLDHLSSVTKAVVLGALMTAFVQGALVGIGFAIVGLPSPVVFAVLASGAALVPLIGTALVWAPAAVVLASQGHAGTAVILSIWGVVVVASVDNFVRPLLISGRAQISTLPVFIGLLGGISAFGPIGMFLGPVLVALVLALLRFAEESRGQAPSQTI